MTALIVLTALPPRPPDCRIAATTYRPPHTAFSGPIVRSSPALNSTVVSLAVQSLWITRRRTRPGATSELTTCGSNFTEISAIAEEARTRLTAGDHEPREELVHLRRRWFRPGARHEHDESDREQDDQAERNLVAPLSDGLERKWANARPDAHPRPRWNHGDRMFGEERAGAMARAGRLGSATLRSHRSTRLMLPGHLDGVNRLIVDLRVDHLPVLTQGEEKGSGGIGARLPPSTGVG